MAVGALARAANASQACWWWWEGSNQRGESASCVVLRLFMVTAAAMSSYFIWRKKTGQLGPPALPPGPRGVPLLGSLPFLGPDLHRCFAELAKAYGPIMSIRIGTKLCVVVSSSAAAKVVLKDQDAVFANRDVTAATRVISYGGRDIAWNNNPADWRFLRKLCVRELLSSSAIKAFYSLRRSEVRRMVREIYRRCGTPVRVGEESSLTLLDVTTSMLWGSTVEGDERSRVEEDFREVIGQITELAAALNVSDIFPAVARFDLQRVEKRMKGLHDWCDNILSKIVEMRRRDAGNGAVGREGRRSSGTRGKDFLQVMLDVVEASGAEELLTVEHLKAVMLDMVMAGTDTSSATVEWAMAEMMRNREILEKAREELESVVGRDAVVEESHLPSLCYLDAVVKETFRLHPAVPLVGRSPSEPCMVRGHHIPREANVLINIWAIHRDPSNWEDPLEFKPERFLRHDAEWDYHGGNGFRFLPFGGGRRICAGISMGETMTMFLLATLLHSFDWELPAGGGVDFAERFSLVMKMARPLTVVPTPRLSNLQLYA